MPSRKIALWALAGLAVLAAAFWLLGRRASRPTADTPPSPTPQSTPAAAEPKAAFRLAVVLDDWGYQADLFPRMEGFPGRLTIAVLPGLAHSRAAATRAHGAGHEVILHLPLQPQGNLPLVPGTLKVGMLRDEAVRLCEAHVRSVPYMSGMNNHEGSKGSADPQLMEFVSGWMKARGGYILDSRTSAKSLLYAKAREAGVPALKRDVFLDNVDEKSAVERQVREALRLALKNGSAIAIGHPRKATFDALEALLPEIRAAGADLAPASALLNQ